LGKLLLALDGASMFSLSAKSDGDAKDYCLDGAKKSKSIANKSRITHRHEAEWHIR